MKNIGSLLMLLIKYKHNSHYIITDAHMSSRTKFLFFSLSCVSLSLIVALHFSTLVLESFILSFTILLIGDNKIVELVGFYKC